MRPMAMVLTFALLLSLWSPQAHTADPKPSKVLTFAAGTVSAISAGLATYLTSGVLIPSLVIGSTSGGVTSVFQYNSKRYSDWVGTPYGWEKTSKQGILSNFVKRAFVGVLVTAGVTLVATLPYVGIEAPAPYTLEGLENVLRNSLAMTYFSTPVNMALSLLAKAKPKNPGPIRRKLVEIISFMVNGTQSASSAAAISQNTPVATAINSALAVAGGIGWGVQSMKKSECTDSLKKAAGQ